MNIRGTAEVIYYSWGLVCEYVGYQGQIYTRIVNGRQYERTLEYDENPFYYVLFIEIKN